MTKVTFKTIEHFFFLPRRINLVTTERLSDCDSFLIEDIWRKK